MTANSPALKLLLAQSRDLESAPPEATARAKAGQHSLLVPALLASQAPPSVCCKGGGLVDQTGLAIAPVIHPSRMDTPLAGDLLELADRSTRRRFKAGQTLMPQR